MTAYSFFNRFVQNCGYHGNRKVPLTFNGESVLRAIAPSVLISSLNLQISRRGIKSRTSSHLGQVGLFVVELLALER